jgi:hypothetical protein
MLPVSEGRVPSKYSAQNGVIFICPSPICLNSRPAELLLKFKLINDITNLSNNKDREFMSASAMTPRVLWYQLRMEAPIGYHNFWMKTTDFWSEIQTDHCRNLNPIRVGMTRIRADCHWISAVGRERNLPLLSPMEAHYPHLLNGDHWILSAITDDYEKCHHSIVRYHSHFSSAICYFSSLK